MKSKNKSRLILLSAVSLLLMVSAGATAPVHAQEDKWEEFALPEGYFPTEIQFFDADDGLAFGKRHIGDGEFIPFIFESSNGGKTWTEQTAAVDKLVDWALSGGFSGEGGSVSSSCKMSEVGELFVVSRQNFYASAVINCELKMEGLSTRPHDLDRIFHTVDGGNSWSSIIFKDASGEFLHVEGNARNLVPSPDGGYWLILYDNDKNARQTFFSSDGETFTPRSIADLPDDSIYMLELPRDSFGYVLAYFEPGNQILVTLDGGETWSEIPLPSGSESHAWLHAHFLDEMTGWLAGSSTVTWDEPMQALVFPEAIYRTADGGVTWEEALVLGIDEDGYNVFLDLREVKFQNSNVGFAVGEYDVWGNNFEDTAPPENILLVTTDGGTTWEFLLRAGYIGCLETTETYVFVCRDGSILRMKLPSPRPTPTPTFTPTLTPVPPTKTVTPLPTSTPLPDSGVNCAGAPALFIVAISLWWFLGKRS